MADTEEIRELVNDALADDDANGNRFTESEFLMFFRSANPEAVRQAWEVYELAAAGGLDCI